MDMFGISSETSGMRRPLSAALVAGTAGAAVALLALALLLLWPVGPAQAQGAAGTEPTDVRVAPGDGLLTVSWKVTPRAGVPDDQIRHALRWSQEPGVWANPRDANAVGRNDGLSVAGGVTSYTITGLKNGVAAGVFVRSFTGGNYTENGPQSSKWVRVKGEHTTPEGAEPERSGSFSLSARATAAEGGDTALTITLSEAAPAAGVEFTVAAGYGDGGATAEDVGSVTSPVTVTGGNNSLDIAIPIVDDRIDEDEESFTVVVATDAAGWEPAGEGQDRARVTIADDDTAGVRVTAANPLNVAEGESASYTVALESQPTHDVTITASSGDEGAAAVSPATRVFTPTDWSVPQSFTVSGVSDEDSADERVGISHQATSHDGKYAVIPVSTVSVAVTEPAQQQKQVSSDARLSGLELSSYSYEGQPTPVIPLRPGFDAATTAYGATAPYNPSHVRVRATASDAGASVTVNGRWVASGAYSDSIALKRNEPQRIEVSVTAEDGQARRVYVITATRDPLAGLSGLEISHGKLHPFFTPDHGAYQAWAPHSVAAVSFTPTNKYASGTIRVEGDEVSSGAASAPVPLQVGENVIRVTATAPDDYTVKTYTITVVRVSAEASADATLSGLEVFPTTHTGPDAADVVHHEVVGYRLTPALTAGVREYAARVPEDVEYVAVTATTTAAGAKTIVVQGPPVSRVEARPPKGRPVSGEASGPWAPFVGHAMISIAVTSLDGENTETYRVTVTQGTVAAASGVELAPGDGTLTLSWAEQAEDHAASRSGIGALARWREAGTQTWLNAAGLSSFKRTYASDAPSGSAADGKRVTGPLVIEGLENGTEYEVELRRTRGGHSSDGVMNWLSSGWVRVQGAPGLTPAALTALVITPGSATREYGGADDLSYTVGGVDPGDSNVVSGSLSRAAGEDAGSYAFDLSGLSVATAYAGKYRLPAAASIANYTITAKPITAISGVTVNTRASDGNTDATFDTSSAEGVGVLPAELAAFRAGGLVVSGAFPLGTPGEHRLRVTYALEDHGSFKAGNYALAVTSDTLPGELSEVAACGSLLMLATDGLPAEGGSPVTVMVGLAQPAGAQGVSVTLTTGGTATVRDDYTLSSATVSIGPGVTGGTATIAVTDDAIDDDDETIILNAAVSAQTASSLTLTIKDNDDAPAPVVDAGCTAPAGGDYDADADGLIEVSCLAQLNAIRWDLDGDGSASDAGYAAAFPNAATGMGCPASGCEGYELTADLDFDGSDWSSGPGWTPIGFGAGIQRTVPVPPFEAVFDGNGHTISNLSIKLHTVISTTSISHGYIGLFSYTGNNAVIRNVGLVSVDVSPTGRGQTAVGGLAGNNYGTISNSYVTGLVSSGFNNIGGLAGQNKGKIIGSYSSASVTGVAHTGGLVGWNYGGIYASYATGNVSGGGMVGGLVGNQMSGGTTLLHSGGTTGEIVASYATGDVSGFNTVGGLAGNAAGTISASYSLGTVSASYDGNVPSLERRLGGLVGNCVYSCPSSDGDSYWNAPASGQASSPHGIGKATAELQQPIGYAGIYANWNVDLDGDGNADDPWDFGKSCQYPVLKYGGLNPDDQRSPCIEDTTTNQPAGNTDYDVDDDGLIEVSNLAQLNAIRWDLDGDGSASDTGYASAFPNAAAGMGCPSSGCLGYELTADLDFDTNGSGEADAGDAYWNGGKGWTPIKEPGDFFNAIFDGNGHTISNLYIRMTGGYPGLFATILSGGSVRNLGLVSVDIYGDVSHPIGGLATYNWGEIRNSYVTGAVSGLRGAGGLIGDAGRTSVVVDSYAAVTITNRGNASAGGLVAHNDSGGIIKGSYATGIVTGQGHWFGGLAGKNAGTITASYANANVTGSGDQVGGLVGNNTGTISSSYASGSVYGDSAGVGGLVGYSSGTVTASYWDTQTSRQSLSAAGIGKTTAELQSPTGYTGIYANWNVDLDGDGNADDPWDFGKSCQYPVLKYGGLNPDDQRAPCEPVAATTSTQEPAKFMQINSGYSWTCGVRTDGRVACWGYNRYAQATPPAGTFKQLSGGGNHTCGVKTDGRVACWGLDLDGQATPPEGTFKQVSGGMLYGCGVKTDGQVACWGTNVTAATPPAGTFDQVSAGHSHACGVRTDGRVACWGYNHYAQPTSPAGTFKQVGAGEYHTCGVRTNGKVVCWGATLSQDTPTEGTFAQVTGGEYFACGLKTNGEVACWGLNVYRATIPPAALFTQISGGGHHVCGLKTDGEVACWGNNEWGRSTPPEKGETGFVYRAEADAYLYELTISAGSLSFNRTETYYEVDVPHAVDSVTFTPTTSHHGATVTVNGNDPVTPVVLDYGVNRVIEVVVTAADGITTKTYVVTVTRARPAKPGSPQDLGLRASTTSITATWQDPGTGDPPDYYVARLQDADGDTTEIRRKADELTATFPNLESGATYTVGVRAGNDGGESAWSESRITVRIPAALGSLALTAITYDGETAVALDPAFVPSKTAYTVKLPEEAMAVRLTPKAQSQYATIAVDGKSMGRRGYVLIGLSPASERVVKVEVKEGGTTRTYAVTLPRKG